MKTNYVPSLINAGIAQVSLGNFSEGEGFFTRAATIEPSNKMAMFNLAVLCEKQGNFDRAYENYSIYHKCGTLTDVSVLPESWRGRDKMPKQPGFIGQSSLSRAQAHQPGSLPING